MARSRRDSRDDREERFILNAIDDGRIIGLDGQCRVAILQVKMPVDRIGDGTGRILGLDQDARHDLDLAVLREMRGHDIPGGTEIDVFLTHPDIGERRGIQVPVAHELKPVRIRVHIHLVVADGKLVCPALHRVGLVAVEHDVVGQVIEIDPVLVHSLHGAVRESLGQQLPLVERPLHAVLLPALPGFIIRPDAGKAQQQQRHDKQQKTAVTQQEAPDPKPIWSAFAHS